MTETLSILPISFWIVIAVLIAGGLRSIRHLQDGTGLPTLTVLGTVTAWYVGDAFYNDYANNHAKLFDSGTLQGAWMQVAWFLVVFLMATPEIHRWMNARYLSRRSGVMALFQHGVDYPAIQSQLRKVFWASASVWIAIFFIALILLKAYVIYFLFPFLGEKFSPWSHERIGSGFDFVSVVGFYLQLLSATLFGVVAALATDRRVRRFALLFCVLAWPYFIFDRTRNTMLAMVIPALLCWVFLRLRGGMLKKVTVLVACFLLINTWMKFVIANRSESTITSAFKEKGLSFANQEKTHNEGLNMFEELCWISTFIDNGRYHVNWGKRYFAELVNPIPRGLWHGKPLIGIDYAIARGQGGGNASAAGVNATVSTGMIGQGVVNFGRILGPVAAALLMSLWVAWLARLDLNVQGLGRLPLYSLGMILTFNLGRDITLITLYPFVFGAVAVWWLEHRQAQSHQPAPATPAAPAVSQGNAVSHPRRSLFVRRVSAGGFVKRNSTSVRTTTAKPAIQSLKSGIQQKNEPQKTDQRGRAQFHFPT